MSNLVPLTDIHQMAEVASKSKMFGFKNTEEAMAIMLLCQAENMHPAVAMRDFHVIQGRPALKADAMLARFQQAGGSVNWKVYTDDEVTGVFSHPQGGSLEVTWTMAHARKIGLAGKDNWNKYGRAMLRARCVSEGIRSVYPGCVVGVYTPEEVESFSPRTPAPAPEVKDMGMADVVNSNPDVVNLKTGEIEDAVFKAVHTGIPLYVPGNDEPHNSFDTPEEWTHGYGDIVRRITQSPKLSDVDKVAKLKSLAEVNAQVTVNFDSFQKAKLKTAIIQNGGTANPKPDASQTSPDLEQNEPASSTI